MKDTIDLSEQNLEELKIDTKYCVDKDVHNLHIRKSSARMLPAIPVVKPDESQTSPIAIVCSGPSLKDSWEQIRQFPIVLTCSGAHDFLIERGITPTYHMETDPRPHKAVFTKNPKEGVMYLIASSCHPDVFDNLVGHDVRVWHVVSQDELHRMPRGHWMVTGGCNVGLRALVVARLMGFRDIHVFGMDCSSDSEKIFHANSHPNEPKEKGHRIVKVAGREFLTSDVFLECARQFFKETMLLSDARVTLYGDGLLQALAIVKMSDPKEIEKRKAYIHQKGGAVIALSLPNTISQQYVYLNRQLHESNFHYGGHGDRYTDIVKKMAESKGVRSILDYGCGKGALAASLDFPIWEYDPCIPGKESAPRPADLVVCTDVLEHIEPENLQAVMEDLKRVTKFTVFFSIHTGPSGKTLADGRNTHLIQQGMDEWRTLISQYFDIAYCAMVGGTPWLYVIGSAKQLKLTKAA